MCAYPIAGLLDISFQEELYDMYLTVTGELSRVQHATHNAILFVQSASGPYSQVERYREVEEGGRVSGCSEVLHII